MVTELTKQRDRLLALLTHHLDCIEYNLKNFATGMDKDTHNRLNAASKTYIKLTDMETLIAQEKSRSVTSHKKYNKQEMLAQLTQKLNGVLSKKQDLQSKNIGDM
jgi:hypothetical protein